MQPKQLLSLIIVAWLSIPGATLSAAAQATVNVNAPSHELAPPIEPLRAWTVASDGTIFVLDAGGILHQLAPSDLQPASQSSPLFPIHARDQVHLVADATHVMVGNEALTQTVVLDRQNLRPLHTLENAGAMTLDPGRHLLMKSAYSRDQMPYKSTILVYDLADLPQIAQTLQTRCMSGPLSADPVGRRLYVAVGNCPSSPPHSGDSHQIYDLDTFAELGIFVPDPFRGALDRAAVARVNGRGVTVNHGLNGTDDLHLFDAQGRTIRSLHATLASNRPAIDSTGRWIYLLYPHGLAVLRAADLAIQSFAPFTNTTASDIALAPDDETLYLFNASGVMTQSTLALQELGIQPVRPFPQAWLQAADPRIQIQPRLYRAPSGGDRETVFLHLQPMPSGESEIYRSRDGGRSWYPLPILHGYTIPVLSISPDFAQDQTLITSYQRSTDGGDTWHPYTAELAFVSDQVGNRELYAMTEYAQTPRRLTYHPAADENPAWSPAYTRLAFQSDRFGDWDIFNLRAECAAVAAECDLRQLTTDPAADVLPAWSPDGRMIAFVSLRDGNPEIYVMDRDGRNERRLTYHPSGDWRPAWLPDSEHLVFVSTRTGNNDIYLVTVPSPDVQLSTEPELTPLVTGAADDRDPAISDSTRLETYLDFEAAQNPYLVFLSDREGIMRTYITGLSAVGPIEPYTAASQPEAHPSWHASDTLLLAIEQETGSDLYKVTLPYATPTSLFVTPGFDGQPAGGPLWWQPDAAASLAWLTAEE